MHHQLWQYDPLYPPLLREINPAPKCLFCLGEELNPDAKYFAIVGTRHPSQYGKQMAAEFSRAIASRGFTIVSGLAYGIDAIAHQAAMDSGGKTIAVLGAGLNHISPPCNLELAKRIETNGCLITEYEANFEAKKGTFPQRNRIIAGMSLATLVIEAPERSGALITARLALEYNRDVFSLPGNIIQETSTGTNRLIRDCKAFPVTCVEDIFEYLKLENINTEKNEEPSLSPKLSDEEKIIYDILKIAPSTIDHIISESKISPQKVGTTISLLEIKGLITVLGSYAFITR